MANGQNAKNLLASIVITTAMEEREWRVCRYEQHERRSTVYQHHSRMEDKKYGGDPNHTFWSSRSTSVLVSKDERPPFNNVLRFFFIVCLNCYCS